MQGINNIDSIDSITLSVSQMVKKKTKTSISKVTTKKSTMKNTQKLNLENLPAYQKKQVKIKNDNI